MFDKISFNHFFLETKTLIDARWVPFINPETQTFFKSGSVYFALSFNPGNVYVNLMVGKESDNAEGMRGLIKELKQSGVRFLRFGTYSKNKRILALYRYIQAQFVKQIDNYYNDGDAYVEYELDLDATARF